LIRFGDKLPDLLVALHAGDILLHDAQQLSGSCVLCINPDELLQHLACPAELLLRG